jgi:hypothetical protein
MTRRFVLALRLTAPAGPRRSPQTPIVEPGLR